MLGLSLAMTLGNPTLNAGVGVPNTLAVYGDSTAFSSGATNDARRWSALVSGDAYPTAWTLYNAGSPGQSITDMANGVVADTTHRGWLTIFMDRPNTGETSAHWLSEVKRAAASRRGYWFVVPPVINSPSGQPDDASTVIGEVQAALLSDADFAGHTLNAAEQAAYIAAMNDDGTRAGGADWVHFNDVGQAIQALFVSAALVRVGRRSERPETAALSARMTGSLTAMRRTLINAMLERHVASGFLALCDAYYCEAQFDEQAANLNWASTSFDMTKAGTVAFAADRGHTGDGNTGSQMAAGIDVTALSGRQMGQDSAGVRVFHLTTPAESKMDIGTTSNPSGGINLSTRNADNSRSYMMFNASTQFGGGGVAGPRCTALVRRTSAAIVANVNGGDISTMSVASVAPAGGAILIGRANTKQRAFAAIGGGWTEEQLGAAYRTEAAYLAALGATWH